MARWGQGWGLDEQWALAVSFSIVSKPVCWQETGKSTIIFTATATSVELATMLSFPPLYPLPFLWSQHPKGGPKEPEDKVKINKIKQNTNTYKQESI